jgi:signal peptide peptidase SppA
MPALPAHNTATVDEAWDGPGEVKKLKTPITGSVAKGMYAWYDDSAADPDGDGWPDAKAAYELPHHVVDDAGNPGAANLRGVRNALSRLSQTKAIPESDYDAVKRHLNHHLEDAKDGGGAQQGSHLAGRVWAVRSEVLADVTRVLRQRRVSIQEAMEAQDALVPVQAQLRDSQIRDGGVAVLSLFGMITPFGSLLSMLFGLGGGLDSFRAQLDEAIANDNISAVAIEVDSPGGLIDMVPETAQAIRDARGTKPIVAVANTMAASAAYWLAAQADEVVVTPSGEVGSIGVLAIHEEISKAAEMAGITTTIIRQPPAKGEGNPFEPLSEEAQQYLQERVDEAYSWFIADVANGRGVSQDAVKAEFGQGRMLSSFPAQTAGMVDRVETFDQTLSRLASEAAPSATPSAKLLTPSQARAAAAVPENDNEPEEDDDLDEKQEKDEANAEPSKAEPNPDPDEEEDEQEKDEAKEADSPSSAARVLDVLSNS